MQDILSTSKFFFEAC